MLLILTLLLVGVPLAVAAVGFLRGALHGAAAERENPGPPGAGCILIATHGGRETIWEAVRKARATGWPVFVVDDATPDSEHEPHPAVLAKLAGAAVLRLAGNVGKPAALRAAVEHWYLDETYDYILVIDDDTFLEPDFVTEALKKMTPDTAIVVGHNRSRVPAGSWNLWQLSRAYSCWLYQLTIRRAQDLGGVLNCISGSNSVYRAALFGDLIRQPCPYIVDDTFWTLEVQRRRLGRIRYAPRAVAELIDPLTFRDWWKQNVRWLWGTYQGILGHRIGTRATRFDAAYLLLILHWAVYLVSGPLLLVTAAHVGALTMLAAGYAVGAGVAAIALKNWRILVAFPVFLGVDLLYRGVMVWSLIKAFRQPHVAECRWESPARS